MDDIPVNAMENPTTLMMITGMKTKMASITTYPFQLRQILTSNDDHESEQHDFTDQTLAFDAQNDNSDDEDSKNTPRKP